MDGEDSLDLGEAITIGNERDNNKEIKADVPIEEYEYLIAFDEPAVEVYITGWEEDTFNDTISCIFDVTVYNNSNIDIEFGVKKLKVNGWNITSEGTYNSIARLDAGEKSRETWQLYDLGEKTDITSLNDLEAIDGLFFVGKGDSWGEIIASQALTITKAELERLTLGR